MFLVRRVCRIENRLNTWKVADLLSKICNDYEEEQGRNKATIYIGGRGTPGQGITVCAEWIQESLGETNVSSGVPSSVKENSPKLVGLVDSYEIEFYELATREKIDQWL